MLDKQIFPMCADLFSHIFYRRLLVDECKNKSRLYSVRFGVGAGLDGYLKSAPCNFNMSHSIGVFENSYMARRVRVDLASLRFGAFAVPNENFFEVLRDLGLQNGPGAPTDRTKEQIEYMEIRRNIIRLRDAYEQTEEAKDTKETGKVKGCLKPTESPSRNCWCWTAGRNVFPRLVVSGPEVIQLTISDVPTPPMPDFTMSWTWNPYWKNGPRWSPRILSKRTVLDQPSTG